MSLLSCSGVVPSAAVTDAALAAAMAAPGFVLPSTLPSPTDCTAAASAWRPALAAAAAVPPLLARFEFELGACRPPTCYVTCFAVPLANVTGALSHAQFHAATQTTSDAALEARMQWQRIASNQV